MVSIYSKIAYLIAAIQIISNILDIVAIALLNKEMKKMCSQFSQGFLSNSQFHKQVANDACSTINNFSSASLVYVIIITIIVTIFVVCEKNSLLL